jgi:hypothetical protein
VQPGASGQYQKHHDIRSLVVLQERWAAVKLSRHASDGAGACGRCVLVTCVGGGGACPEAGGAGVLALVLDDCGHCREGELLLSPEAFR